MHQAYSFIQFNGLFGVVFAATGTAYDVAMLPVECAKCEEPSAHKIRELERIEKVTCQHCKAEIDISSPSWRERISVSAAASKDV